MLANAFLPLVLAAPLMFLVIINDLKRMRIPNWLSLATIAVFVLTVPLVQPMDETLARLAAAAIVFALGFAAFASGAVGGGDVKILSALMLLIPIEALPLFSLILSATLMGGAALVLGLRAVMRTPVEGWRFLETKKFPMGLSIGTAALALPAAATTML